MTLLLPDRDRPGQHPAPVAPASSPARTAVVALLAVGAAVLAVSLQGRVGLALPIVLAVLVLLSVFALKEFPTFLGCLLVVRPLLDLLKSGSLSSVFQPTSLLSIGLLAVAPLWLVAQRRQSRVPVTPMAVATTGFVLALLISTVGSDSPIGSLPEFLKGCSWLAMFFVVRRMVATERDVRRLVLALAASAVIPALLAVYELATPGAGRFSEVKDGIVRLRSTFDQSNNYARFLMLLLTVGLPMLRLLRGWQRLALAGVLGLSGFLLALTYTRAAWIGLFAGMLVIAVLRGRILLLVGLAAAAVMVLAVPPVTHEVLSLARPTTADSASSNNSVGWRFSYWQEIAPLALEHPLSGIGPGETVVRSRDGKEPHNEYLRAVIEGGVVGTIAYLALLAVAFAACARVARRAASPLGQAVGTGAAATVAAVVVCGAASNVIDMVSFMWFFAAVIAVADRYAWSPSRDLPHPTPTPDAVRTAPWT